MDKLQGSIETLSALQITADTRGLDAQSKTILYHAEILAIILQETVSEYKGYSRQEIRDFIEADSITSTTEVSPGRTNTEIRGDNPEFTYLNEKASLFDLAFRAKNPLLSTKDIQINLHIDVEPQKTYKPGYPIEKRGMYYLARRLSSQLSLVLAGTDYSQLSKCYSIWICRDDIPPEDRYSISIYEMTNTRNTAPDTIAKENYDLMTLVVIKLGNEVYNGTEEDEGYDLLRFLNAIMYPHKDDFMVTVKEYIDYSENAELWKEVTNVSSLEQVIFEGARDDGLKAARREVEKEVKEVKEKFKKEFKKAEEDIRKAEEEARKAEEEARKAEEEARKAEEEARKAEEEARKAEEEARKAEEEARKAEEKAREAEEKIYEVKEEVCKAKEIGIQAMILDNFEERVPKERIIMKLQKHFKLTKEKSEQYYQRYTANL